MFGSVASVEEAELVCRELRQVCDFADWYNLDGVLMVGYLFDGRLPESAEHHATVREVLALI